MAHHAQAQALAAAPPAPPAAADDQPQLPSQPLVEAHALLNACSESSLRSLLQAFDVRSLRRLLHVYANSMASSDLTSFSFMVQTFAMPEELGAALPCPQNNDRGLFLRLPSDLWCSCIFHFLPVLTVLGPISLASRQFRLFAADPRSWKRLGLDQLPIADFSDFSQWHDPRLAGYLGVWRAAVELALCPNMHHRDLERVLAPWSARLQVLHAGTVGMTALRDCRCLRSLRCSALRTPWTDAKPSEPTVVAAADAADAALLSTTMWPALTSVQVGCMSHNALALLAHNAPLLASLVCRSCQLYDACLLALSTGCRQLQVVCFGRVALRAADSVSRSDPLQQLSVSRASVCQFLQQLPRLRSFRVMSARPAMLAAELCCGIGLARQQQQQQGQGHGLEQLEELALPLQCHLRSNDCWRVAEAAAEAAANKMAHAGLMHLLSVGGADALTPALPHLRDLQLSHVRLSHALCAALSRHCPLLLRVRFAFFSLEDGNFGLDPFIQLFLVPRAGRMQALALTDARLDSAGLRPLDLRGLCAACAGPALESFIVTDIAVDDGDVGSLTGVLEPLATCCPRLCELLLCAAAHDSAIQAGPSLPLPEALLCKLWTGPAHLSVSSFRTSFHIPFQQLRQLVLGCPSLRRVEVPFILPAEPAEQQQQQQQFNAAHPWQQRRFPPHFSRFPR